MTAEQKYVLALDLGSTGLKAAIVSDSGDVIARAYEDNPIIILPDGVGEQDADNWWAISLKASKKVIADSGVNPDQIVGICCDSQYFLIVPVNEKAEPLMNAISWRDTRGAKHNQKLMKGFPSVSGMSLKKLIKYIRLTGIAPTNTGADSLAHMLVVKNELPEIYEKTHKFLEPMDYLTSRFTGKISASQHTATTMMQSSNRSWGEQEYNDDLLKLSGVDRNKLPDLLPSDGIVGNLDESVAKELGLSPSTQVICGMFDNQAAIAGAGIVDIQQGLLLVSTTLSLNGYIDSKKTDILKSIASMPACVADKYMLLCEQGLGGKCLDYFLNNIVHNDDDFKFGEMPEDAFTRLNAMAAEVPPGSDNVLFLPWLNGAVAPAENRNVRGGFFNLSLDTNRCHLTRAVMEGVAFNSRSALGAVENFMGSKFESLRFAGGGALSDIWSQIYADILQIPIQQMDDPIQVTCRGAGLIGLARLGHLKMEDIPKRVKVKKTYEPNSANIAIYDKLYTQFQAIFNNNQKIFNALNG